MKPWAKPASAVEVEHELDGVRRPRLAGARFVALTGYGQPEDRRRTREAGFQDHLTKPIDLEKLAQLLDGIRTARAIRRPLA